MALEEPPRDENPIEINGVPFLVTDTAKPWVEGATVDYIKEERREGFTITAKPPPERNPDDDW